MDKYATAGERKLVDAYLGLTSKSANPAPTKSSLSTKAPIRILAEDETRKSRI